MFKYRFAVLNCSKKQFVKLINLGLRVVTSLSGNVLYTTPIPTTVALLAAIDDLQLAYTAWGDSHNRGSHAQYEDLLQKAAIAHNLLKAMLEYVNNTAQLAAGGDYATLEAILSTSGFDLNKVSTPVGKLPMVKNFRSVVSKTLSRNQVKITWGLPEGTTAGDVSFYIVLRGTTSVFVDAVVISQQTNNKFIDTNNGPVVNYWYWVVACNSDGQGVPSQAVALTLLNP